ncbi:hypothetical protein CVCC1112_336 [Paenarthrobacter nicotinovorans]|nr:hypothetical protein CVCC1112_336 [Paenarthrobacter nicotinovorans]
MGLAALLVAKAGKVPCFRKKSGAIAIPWQDFPLHLLAAIPAVCTAFSLAGSPYENARTHLRAPTLTSPASRIGQDKGISGVGDISSVGHRLPHRDLRPRDGRVSLFTPGIRSC